MDFNLERSAKGEKKPTRKSEEIGGNKRDGGRNGQESNFW